MKMYLEKNRNLRRVRTLLVLLLIQWTLPAMGQSLYSSFSSIDNILSGDNQLPRVSVYECSEVAIDAFAIDEVISEKINRILEDYSQGEQSAQLESVSATLIEAEVSLEGAGYGQYLILQKINITKGSMEIIQTIQGLVNIFVTPSQDACGIESVIAI